MKWERQAECPIMEDLNEAAELGEQFVTVIRRLQRDLEVCELCDEFEICFITQSLNPMIDEVIMEINDEWGITL